MNGCTKFSSHPEDSRSSSWWGLLWTLVMKPTHAQAWQLNELFEGGGCSLGNRNETSSLGLIWKWSTVWKIVLGLNWPGFCHFKNEETWDPGKKWPVQVYLYSLGKPGARGKVSCLPELDPIAFIWKHSPLWLLCAVPHPKGPSFHLAELGES